MDVITDKATIHCGHDGNVNNKASQRWVTVGSAPVLVDNDPEGRDITACPSYGANIKPCAKTLVVDVGYSTWIRVDGKRIVLSNLDGLTDGTVPGTVHYQVRDPWQAYTRADS
jgi:hypothetical protein